MFAYLSVDRECDTRRIVDQLLQEGRRVALPRSRKGGVMDFALYDGALTEGMYGIPQPPDEAETVEPGESDLILVPALCCDVHGVRLGHGGGYYDRYLAEHRVPDCLPLPRAAAAWKRCQRTGTILLSPTS